MGMQAVPRHLSASDHKSERAVTTSTLYFLNASLKTLLEDFSCGVIRGTLGFPRTQFLSHTLTSIMMGSTVPRLWSHPQEVLLRCAEFSCPVGSHVHWRVRTCSRERRERPAYEIMFRRLTVQKHDGAILFEVQMLLTRPSKAKENVNSQMLCGASGIFTRITA
ncbi:hypothetical protein MG293_006402 [Ovis ammon polii]|uniref:Uncharacterized protein n=1 Tax=Ovis ammon polii TaxID=230172 RepID=A0AAD4UCI9_OVIAM|nr:hypothetical protein MG293_006402 [Ovis ammon polii]KAI4570535.1 hypothetical protein MJT46_006052 [Ovis ammon polii x Ovis aries]